MLIYLILLYLSTVYCQIYNNYVTTSFIINHYNYGSDEDYIWTFITPNNLYNGHWNITFTFFLLTDDTLLIYDGPNSNSNILANIINNNITPSPLSGFSDRFITVQFTSGDEYTSGYGFSFIANYTNYNSRSSTTIYSAQNFAINSCTGITINSPGYNYMWILTISSATFGNHWDTFSIYSISSLSYYQYIQFPISSTSYLQYQFTSTNPIYLSYDSQKNSNSSSTPSINLNLIQIDTSCYPMIYSGISFTVRPFQKICWTFNYPPNNYFWQATITGYLLNGDYISTSNYNDCFITNCSFISSISFTMTYNFGNQQFSTYNSSQNLLINLILVYSPTPTYAPYPPETPYPTYNNDNGLNVSTLLILVGALILFLGVFMCIYFYREGYCKCNNENNNANYEPLLPLPEQQLPLQPVVNIKFDAPCIKNINHINNNDIIIEHHNAPELNILNYNIRIAEDGKN